ncbi:alpha/beta hydrolase [Geodermatophilus normandii]|uniref:Alpha/beta hydrolase n=1 Tax=Geodermatophilus normandii TaxID=1137989 RepID=A0A6P0G991_9ACTN|nr:alpha/beta hydrolase [Geodermatophilus normandii]NEM04726.1 alpha/beta hydrolase [Geodermatophilus normandii]
MSPRSLASSLACALAFSVVAASSAAAEEPSGPRHVEGTVDDGATAWVADVPAHWNGTVLLYSHGYRPSFLPIPPSAENAPDDATRQALLDRGYALVGSSYERGGWTLDTAAEDQLQTLDAFRAAVGRPSRVLAVGTSMGGLVTGQLAELPGTPIDGALPTCGLMHGGVDLLNYQLDGAHAITQLLVPEGTEVRLVDYGGDLAAVNATARTLTDAVVAAQDDPEGRARIALAAALYHLPRWAEGQDEPDPRDHEAQVDAQVAQFTFALGFTYPARVDIEDTVGGNPSWNAGVDYRALLRHADERAQVEALYRAAGLDLDADLDRLTETASVTADEDALHTAYATSELTGDLQVPVLSLHTTHDVLAPVQVEEEYAETVRRAGARGLLRQAFVYRLGHCEFTPAELVASVEALDERVATGHWGSGANSRRLDAAAEALGLGASEILPDHRPAEWLGDRGGLLGGPRS